MACVMPDHESVSDGENHTARVHKWVSKLTLEDQEYALEPIASTEPPAVDSGATLVEGPGPMVTSSFDKAGDDIDSRVGAPPIVHE